MPQSRSDQPIEFKPLTVSIERSGQLRFGWDSDPQPTDTSTHVEIEMEEPERWDGLS